MLRSALLGLAATGAAAAFSSVFIDASNLQLVLRPGGASLAVHSLDVAELPRRLGALAELLGGSPAVHAVFDGASFGRAHEGASWTCEDPTIRVAFTDGARTSADDALVALAQEAGAAARAPPAEAVSSGRAIELLERGALSSAPAGGVLAATLKRSASGKSKRDTREAFLKTVGLTKMGDTAHLPAFTEAQRARSLALARGMHKLDRGTLALSHLEAPAAIVVSDDRGLRRRCFALPNPPAVLGRSQLFNLLDALGGGEEG